MTMPTKTPSEPIRAEDQCDGVVFDTFIQVRITHKEQLADIAMLRYGAKHNVEGLGIIEVEYVCQMLNGEVVIAPDLGLEDHTAT